MWRLMHECNVDVCSLPHTRSSSPLRAAALHFHPSTKLMFGEQTDAALRFFHLPEKPS